MEGDGTGSLPFREKQLFKLSVIQLIFGSVLLIASIHGFLYRSLDFPRNAYAVQLVTNSMLVLTGIIGIAATMGKHRNIQRKGHFLTLVVLNILLSIWLGLTCLALIIVGIVTANHDGMVVGWSFFLVALIINTAIFLICVKASVISIENMSFSSSSTPPPEIMEYPVCTCSTSTGSGLQYPVDVVLGDGGSSLSSEGETGVADFHSSVLGSTGIGWSNVEYSEHALEARRARPRATEEVRRLQIMRVKATDPPPSYQSVVYGDGTDT